MRTSLVRIGNSRGIRIPKAVIEQVGLRDRVELSVERGRLVIRPDRAPREGWDEDFAGCGDEGALLGEVTNAFDRDEWTW
jgi:antitoxin MazE